MNRLLLAFAASAVLLVGFVLVFGPVDLALAIARTDPVVFSMGLVLVVVALVCWSEAMRPMLADAGGSVSARRTFVAFATSMTGRQLIPLGAIGGPALTAYAIDRESELSYDQTLAVVTVAEFLSTIASLSLAAAGLIVVAATGRVESRLRLFAVALLAFAALFLALAVTLWYRRRTVERLVLGALRFLELTVGARWDRLADAVDPSRAAASLQRFYDTIDLVAANRSSLTVSFTYHQLGWICMALPLYTSALALDADVSLALVAFVVPASLLVDILPLPGGLGGIEFVMAGMLTGLAGIDAVLAGAIVVLYRLCSYWFVIAVGGAAAVVGTVSVRDIVTHARGQ